MAPIRMERQARRAASMSYGSGSRSRGWIEVLCRAAGCSLALVVFTGELGNPLGGIGRGQVLACLFRISQQPRELGDGCELVRTCRLVRGCLWEVGAIRLSALAGHTW